MFANLFVLSSAKKIFMIVFLFPYLFFLILYVKHPFLFGRKVWMVIKILVPIFLNILPSCSTLSWSWMSLWTNLRPNWFFSLLGTWSWLGCLKGCLSFKYNNLIRICLHIQINSESFSRAYGILSIWRFGTSFISGIFLIIIFIIYLCKYSDPLFLSSLDFLLLFLYLFIPQILLKTRDIASAFQSELFSFRKFICWHILRSATDQPSYNSLCFLLCDFLPTSCIFQDPTHMECFKIS